MGFYTVFLSVRLHQTCYEKNCRSSRIELIERVFIGSVIIFLFFRRRALMEVQALAALGTWMLTDRSLMMTIWFYFFWCMIKFISGYHEHIISYFTSWFENKQLYIQMELCDNSLSLNNYSRMATDVVLEIMYQVSSLCLLVNSSSFFSVHCVLIWS